MSKGKRELNNVVVDQFIRCLYSKYSPIIGNNDASGMIHFFKIMSLRVKINKLQFKRICCIIIKFMECCKHEMNYMQFLKYSMKRLIVTAFVLSVPNTGTDEAERSMIRDDIYALYSKVTGLKISEIVNCCSIIRPILIRITREQYKASRLNNTNKNNHHNTLAFSDYSSDTSNELNPRLTFQQPFDISSAFNFTRRDHLGTIAPSSLSDSMMMDLAGFGELDNDNAWRSGTGTTQQHSTIDGCVSNDYILGAELQRFNDISYKMIHTNYKLT